MAISNKLKLTPYQDSFEDAFLAYKEKLHKILKGVNHSIVHFGSTSIPQTIGKGVIDVMVILNDNSNLLKAKKYLEQCGYFYKDSGKNKNRIFLANNPIESQPFDMHIHLVIKDTPEQKNPLRFAQALRENQDLVKKYNALKLRLSRETNKDRRIYTQEKSAFIEQVIKNAVS